MIIPVLAALTISTSPWIIVALFGAAVLVPLAWFALRPAEPDRGALAVGLGLRLIGVALVLFALLDPQWVSPRAKQGANLVAVVADNSQGLQISAPGADTTRAEQMRTSLNGTADAVSWVELLGLDFQVRPYAFDRALRRVRDFAELDFSGERSDIGGALHALRERFSGQPLAAIVLLTDGNATDLPTGFTDAEGLPPVYPVVVGDDTTLNDFRIERADLRQTAFDDAPVSLRVTVGGNQAREQVEVAVRALTAGADDGASLPPARNVTPTGSDQLADATFDWRPTGTGVQFYEVALTARDPEAEATLLNNRRIVMVDRGQPTYRILYVGGRPNWEFKYLNRALLEDPQLDLVALLRIARREPKFEFRGRAGESNNPLYRGFNRATDEAPRYDEPVLTRVNIRDEDELRAGFPRTAEELFAYDALILDDIEADFFSPDQQLLLRRFAADRGAGILMLGGVDTLENGNYQETPLAAALPVYLDRLPTAPPFGQLTWSLTREGWLEPWTRVRAVETDERDRLIDMPRFAIANGLATAKPGATVLASLEDESGRTFPGLVSQKFGSGRVATMAVGDLWRWGLRGPVEQADLAKFWRQVSRWLVTDNARPVELRVRPATETAGVTLQVTVRDEAYQPLDLANVKLTVRRIALDGEEPGTGFTQATLPAEPDPDLPGRYTAPFHAGEAGGYLATVEVTDRTGKRLGQAEAGWVNDPAAEEFASLQPNRALLAEIARQTGGRVLQLDDTAALAELGEALSRSPAPITETTSRPVWHNSLIFLLVLGCFLSEWAWRRLKGLP